MRCRADGPGVIIKEWPALGKEGLGQPRPFIGAVQDFPQLWCEDLKIRRYTGKAFPSLPAVIGNAVWTEVGGQQTQKRAVVLQRTQGQWLILKTFLRLLPSWHGLAGRYVP